jgi:hypothetical protein
MRWVKICTWYCHYQRVMQNSTCGSLYCLQYLLFNKEGVAVSVQRVLCTLAENNCLTKSKSQLNPQHNSMEQSSSWEAGSCWVSQEIPRPLWNPKVHYRVHKNLPLDPVLSHMNPVLAFEICLFKIRFNIILPRMFRSSKWSHLFRV